MCIRRRHLQLVLTVAVVALAGAWWFWPEPSVISRATAERIRVGMTLAEVEAILGGPARDESSGGLVLSNRGIISPTRKDWIGPDVAVLILSDNGRVSFIIMNDVVPARDATTLQMLRRLLRL